MYMSSMMSELYDYMRVCVEEEYNEDEYDPKVELDYNYWVGEEDVIVAQPQ